MKPAIVPAALLALAAVLPAATRASAAQAATTSSALDAEVRRFFDGLEVAFAEGDPERLFALLSSRFEDDFERNGRARMSERLASVARAGDRIAFDVLRVAAAGDGAATAIVRTRIEGPPRTGPRAAETQVDLFVLRREGKGALVAARRLGLDEAGERRIAGGTYRAADGSFEISTPAGFAIATPRRKVGTAFDTVYLVDPSSDAYVLFVAFAIPYELDSLETLARLDAEKLAALSDEGTTPRVAAEGRFSAAGLEGYELVAQATIGGREQVFRRVCLQRRSTCYQFLCRSAPAEAFARDSASFDEAIARFRLVEDAPPVRRGAVDGTLYRHDDLGFEIGAPAGWAIEEVRSSYSAQVFFTPGSGRAYAMLCALEVGTAVEPESLAAIIDEDEKERRKTVPSIVRRSPIETLEVDGCPARSVVQGYPVEGFERTAKSVYVASGATLFVLILNAPPAEFDALEPGFDALVQSFIRTP